MAPSKTTAMCSPRCGCPMLLQHLSVRAMTLATGGKVVAEQRALCATLSVTILDQVARRSLCATANPECAAGDAGQSHCTLSLPIHDCCGACSHGYRCSPLIPIVCTDMQSHLSAIQQWSIWNWLGCQVAGLYRHLVSTNELKSTSSTLTYSITNWIPTVSEHARQMRTALLSTSQTSAALPLPASGLLYAYVRHQLLCRACV